jgi:hypothetical protein
MRAVVFLLLAAGPSLLNAQEQPKPDAQLSPQAAYDQAVRPLDITRRSPQNWSEVELAALKVAREQAKPACAARNPDEFAGDDLVALAHLCAFAQMWQPVHQAAAKYVLAAQAATAELDSKGMIALATAFDYKVQASLNLNDPDDAVATTQTMLRTVPYDEFASEATNSTLHYIHFIRIPQALQLLAQRQAILLELIKGYALKADAPAAQPRLPVHALYADALALPAMQQFTNRLEDAENSYAELEAALPAALSSEDGMFIEEKRRQYLLLGKHLPRLKAMGSLLTPDAPVPDNLNTRFTQANVFLLFPDWCNQCIAMVFNGAARPKQLLEERHALFFPLMAQVDPPEKRAKPAIKDVPLPPSKSGKGPQLGSKPGERLHVDQQLAIKSTPDARLEGTPTVIVPMETLDAFAAVDFPLIVATDHNGVVRFVQVAQEDALTPGGEIDQIVMHIADTWPPD